jgi:hypothetical protein
MKIFRKVLIVLLILLGLLLVSAVGIGVYINGKYAVLTAAPRVTHTDATSAYPTFRAMLDPVLANAFAGGLREEFSNQGAPPWLIDYAMPREISLILTSDHDASSILASFFINEKRLGPLIAEAFNQTNTRALYTQFQWAPGGMKLQERGRLMLEASYPMEANAKDAVLYDGWWTHERVPSPFKPEGGHLLEVVGDNRRGGAYLAAASLLQVFGYDLNAQMEDVSITSFVFVERADFHVDRTEDDQLRLYLSFDIQEGKERRIAVISLETGLNTAFEAWQKALAEHHNLKLEGGSHWEGSKLVFGFTLPEAGRALKTLLGTP